MTPAAAVGTYMALAAPVEVDLEELPEPVTLGLEPTPEGLATVPLQKNLPRMAELDFSFWKASQPLSSAED